MSYLEEAYHYNTNKKSLLETARHSKNILVCKKLPYWSLLFMTIAIVGEIVERYMVRKSGVNWYWNTLMKEKTVCVIERPLVRLPVAASFYH